MTLEVLLIIAFGGALLTYIFGKISSRLRGIFAVVLSLVLVIMVGFLYGKPQKEVFYLGFLGFPLVLRANIFSWFFAIAISSLGALSVIFSLSYMEGKERLNFYYSMMLLVNAAMLGIVFAGDLLSFYIFWEIMSWSTFLLISYNRGRALSAGMKYILMSIVGSIAYLVGMLSLYSTYGTLNMSEISSYMASASHGYILFLLTLFGITFGIKNAVMPLHTWLPDAHSEAPSPFSSILSGILIKMGTYGFILMMYGIVGLKLLLSFTHGVFIFPYILSILGAITIIVPSFVAILQDDAKRLLAWSSIAQVGYIILGIGVGTNLGFVGGVFHFFNHAIFKALLFLAVGAVEYRAGTRNLNSLGGLVKKMPVTFIVVLIGACGLIGVPLANGFVSKWLIYKTLILNMHPFFAFAALVGTWGTILYSYKLIHNIFLGQLPEKYKDVEEAPISMRIPTIILAALVVLFGILPGIPLKIINSIGTFFGYRSLGVNIWGISSETGVLNTVNIFAAILIAGIVIWIFFRMGARSKLVLQDDNYAAGAYIAKERYNYTVSFYDPLSRIFSIFLKKDMVDEFYGRVAQNIKELCSGVRKVYTGYVGNYVMYITLFLATLLVIGMMGWKLW